MRRGTLRPSNEVIHEQQRRFPQMNHGSGICPRWGWPPCSG